MSSKLKSDVCCRLQVAPSGESYGGNRRPGRKQRQTTAGYMAWFTSRHLRDQLRAQRSVTSMRKLCKLFFYLGGLVPERYNQSGFYWSNTVQYAFVGIVTLLKQFFPAY